MRSASVSALKNYLMCHRKYYYSHVEYLPTDPAETTKRFALDNILRATLTNFHEVGNPEWSALEQSLLSKWDHSMFADQHASAEQYQKARYMLWESFGSITTGRVFRCNFAFDFTFGGGKFRGTIDRIDDEGQELVLVRYVRGEHPEGRDNWGLHIYAAVAAKLFRKRVRAIRIIQIGHVGPDVWLSAQDPGKVEGDVSRLRRSMSDNHSFHPRPDRHCITCPYAKICDAAWEEPGRATKNPHEMYRLLCAVEILMNPGESERALRRSMEASVQQLDSTARIIWLENLRISDEVTILIRAGADTQGELAENDGVLSLVAGASLLVPIAAAGVAVFPEAVTRNAGEALSRSLRISWTHSLKYRAATLDGLTGLYRREVGERQYAASSEPLTFIMCDIDRFKGINDKYGHDAGDAALKVVARILKAQAGAVAYRWGGEEFLLIVPGADLDYAKTISESIRLEIESTLLQDGEHAIRLTASFGISSGDGRSEARAHTLKRADTALYQAKEQGRNCIVFAG